MSLINKYRPTGFGAVAGNEKAVAGIKDMLDKKDPKHSFLLSGPRGCGKTTLGRIIAQHVGCDMENNFIEVDSADFRGIDTIRNLRKTINFQGLGGGVRVYLMDECHKLTKDAQEAFLKTVEEPPNHVYIILATTDPQMLKPTLRDRCAEFIVAPLEQDECIKFLKKIARREKVTIPDDILETIAEKSEGRPRSSLALLEKILALDPDDMEAAIEQEKFLESATIDLCRALMACQPWLKIAKIIKGLEKEEPESIRRSVLGYCTGIMLRGDDPLAYVVADIFQDPWYTNGRPDLVLACYAVLDELKDEDE